MLNNKKIIVLMMAFVFLLNGCASTPDCLDSELKNNEISLENSSFLFDYNEKNFERVFPKYLISAGDVLDVLFRINTDSSDDGYQYKLENDNNIHIKFTHVPELNEEQFIRPDGTISLPLVGLVKAAGKTVSELKQELFIKYSRVLQNPEFYILVHGFNKRIEDLKKDLHTAPRGLSRLVTVRPDGYVTFPMAGEVKVHGHTITEINQQLNADYATIFRGLEVDLFLQKSAGSNVFVLGNVTKAGAYEITRPTTILEALALAEGMLPSTEHKEVIVLRRNDELKKLVARKVNIEGVLNFECASTTFFLKPFDIVYVPKTGLANAAEVANDLREAVMFRGWGINLSPIGGLIQ